MSKSCGNCSYFLKVKNDGFYGSSLCEYKDSRTKSDKGHTCKNWKGIKYKRQKEKADHNGRPLKERKRGGIKF